VSFHWQNPKTDANQRKPTQEFESAKSMAAQDFSEKVPSLLGFLETGVKNPCLPATLQLCEFRNVF
jgi:hypothetical protein